MLNTYLTSQWGLRYPILNASMTPAAEGKLARAVTDAGGFGMIGVNETWTCEDIDRECAVAREGNEKRLFGIGLFGWALEAHPEVLERAIAQSRHFISISFLDVAPYAARVHDAGIYLGVKVQSRRDADALCTRAWTSSLHKARKPAVTPGMFPRSQCSRSRLV